MAHGPNYDTQMRRLEARSEHAIHVSERSYRRLFEAARDGILILDAETGRITDVNPFLTELLGFSHSEMVGKTVGELSPFKDIESNKVMLDRLQKTGYARYEDLPLETRGGRRIAVEFVSNVYQSGVGKVIQCNIRDITERKGSEERLKTSFKEVTDLKFSMDGHLASARLAAIIESSDDAIFGIDLGGTITSWNRGAEQIFGYAASEMIGASIMRLIPAECQQEESEILKKVMRGERVEHFETVRLTMDGRQIDVSSTTSAIKDSSGKIIGASKVVRDVTDRKRGEKTHLLNVNLEQRVAERTAELQGANDELQAFSYSVSHDLRAPLRHIIGFAGALQKEAGASLSGKGLSHLTTISESATRMGKLIDDLLAFSRVGRTEVKKNEVNLDQLVGETLDDFKAETEKRKIAWKVCPLPTVRADRALLRLALINLIGNAVKFTAGRDKPKIEIGCSASGDEAAVIFIRDNGAGFDPLYSGKLFGVFQRLHSQEEFEGTGIGLANVQRIIQRHGGRVWAEGIVDGGATFYFSLPKR